MAASAAATMIPIDADGLRRGGDRLLRQRGHRGKLRIFGSAPRRMSAMLRVSCWTGTERACSFAPHSGRPTRMTAPSPSARERRARAGSRAAPRRAPRPARAPARRPRRARPGRGCRAPTPPRCVKPGQRLDAGQQPGRALVGDRLERLRACRASRASRDLARRTGPRARAAAAAGAGRARRRRRGAARPCRTRRPGRRRRRSAAGGARARSGSSAAGRRAARPGARREPGAGSPPARGRS